MNFSTIGLIGWGRFSQILTKHLLEHFPNAQVLISSRQKQLKLPLRVKQVSLKKVSQSSIVIPCVPISKFESVIKKLKPHLKPGTLFIDICSVKTHPVKIMKQHLPKNINILATHPMWGPDSAKASLENLATVICPIRVPKKLINQIKKFAKTINHQIITTTPEQHDKWLAKSQAITHLYGRLNQSLGVKSTPINTKGFEKLLKIQSFVVHDSIELFNDMLIYNPHAQTMLKNINHEVNLLCQKLKIK